MGYKEYILYKHTRTVYMFYAYNSQENDVEDEHKPGDESDRQHYSLNLYE